MKKAYLIFFFSALAGTLAAQNIERKIIIDHGKYYFTTIDDQFQVATLSTGNTTEPLKSAKKLALPLGRNYDDPVIPFCWDIRDTSLYAINFLVHPMNDRYEAIKRLNITTLKSWGPEVTALNMIMQGTDMNPYALNEPYDYTIKRNNTLEDFFFDGIALNDSTYCVAICNKGELTFWNHNPKGWKHSEVIKFTAGGYFSIFQHNRKAYLMMNSGALYEASQKGINPVDQKPAGTLAAGILVINKDKNTIHYLKNNDLNQSTPLDEILEKKAIKIL